MNVIVGSAHRNCAPVVPRYMRQVASLRDLLEQREHCLRVVAVEGDSNDDTAVALVRTARQMSLDLELVKHNHGGPPFGSTEDPARMRALSGVCNAIFESVREGDDVLLYIESDLLWDCHPIEFLIEEASRAIWGFDIIAPLVMAGECFYDVWGYRDLDGNRFGPFPPYHHALGSRIMEIGSAGSCLAMRGEIARRCRVRNDLALVGWCADARGHGYRIGVDPNIVVRHPA